MRIHNTAYNEKNSTIILRYPFRIHDCADPDPTKSGKSGTTANGWGVGYLSNLLIPALQLLLQDRLF